MSYKPVASFICMILRLFISSSMVNGDVKECSVMWSSRILSIDDRCIELRFSFIKSW